MNDDKRTGRCARWVAALAVTAAVGAALVATERRAEACGGGEAKGGIPAELVLFGLTVAVTDVSLTLHDLAVDDSSRGYAVFETMVTVPQAAIGLMALSDGGLDGDAQTQVGLYTGWMAALAIHGIYEMVESDDPSPAEETPRPEYRGPPGAFTAIRIRAAPTSVVDSGGGLSPGMGVVGTFW